VLQPSLKVQFLIKVNSEGQEPGNVAESEKVLLTGPLQLSVAVGIPAKKVLLGSLQGTGLPLKGDTVGAVLSLTVTVCNAVAVNPQLSVICHWMTRTDPQAVLLDVKVEDIAFWFIPQASETVGDPVLTFPAEQSVDVLGGAVMLGFKVSLIVTVCTKLVGIPEQSFAVHLLVITWLQLIVPEVLSIGPTTVGLNPHESVNSGPAGKTTDPHSKVAEVTGLLLKTGAALSEKRISWIAVAPLFPHPSVPTHVLLKTLKHPPSGINAVFEMVYDAGPEQLSVPVAVPALKVGEPIKVQSKKDVEGGIIEGPVMSVTLIVWM
jgi:hypothetical protein